MAIGNKHSSTSANPLTDEESESMSNSTEVDVSTIGEVHEISFFCFHVLTCTIAKVELPFNDVLKLLVVVNVVVTWSLQWK